jgi:hypothetical protein
MTHGTCVTISRDDSKADIALLGIEMGVNPNQRRKEWLRKG